MTGTSSYHRRSCPHDSQCELPVFDRLVWSLYDTTPRKLPMIVPKTKRRPRIYHKGNRDMISIMFTSIPYRCVCECSYIQKHPLRDVFAIRPTWSDYGHAVALAARTAVDAFEAPVLSTHHILGVPLVEPLSAACATHVPDASWHCPPLYVAAVASA